MGHMGNSLLRQIETVPAGSLEFYPGNPRRGNVEVIAASLRENDQYAPLVVQKSTRYVLAGNHTLKAARSLGWEQVDVVMVDVDDDRARKILLSSNRTAELGTYDDASLAALLAGLDGDYDGTGWSDADYTALLSVPPESRTDPDDVPEPPAEPVTQPGDVWELGPHRLICGDATDVLAVERMLDGDRCDCMWTDPPYGVEYVGKTKDALTIRNDGATDLPELLAGAFAVATAALKPGAALYIAHPPGALCTAFQQAFTNAGWRFHEGLVWVKDRMVLGHADYHYRHEPIMYGYTPCEGRRGRGGAGWYGSNSETSIFEIPRPSRSEQHPTMKPVALITPMLANSTPRNGLVYDPFGGSGSTLIAAHQLGRMARLVEIDPAYCDVIVARYEAHTGIKPELAARVTDKMAG